MYSHACFYIAHTHYECLSHVLACMPMYEDRLKSNPLWDLCFQKSLKLNLYLFTAFIIKPEVVRTMTMTQCLSSHDPTEKSSISHSYVSMSSSEDVDVGHGGDLH